MSHAIERRSAVAGKIEVSRNSSEHSRINIRDVERDLLLLSNHQEILLVHLNKELNNALNRVVKKAQMLYETSSYEDFYIMVKDIFNRDERRGMVLKIGSVGAFFRGYESYRGDLPSKFIAPTVSMGLPPAGKSKEYTNQPHSSLTISRSPKHNVPSQITINHKGNHQAYIFMTTGRFLGLRPNEIRFLIQEGIKEYKIVVYRNGTYNTQPGEFKQIDNVKYATDHECRYHESFGGSLLSTISIIVITILILCFIMMFGTSKFR